MTNGNQLSDMIQSRVFRPWPGRHCRADPATHLESVAANVGREWGSEEEHGGSSLVGGAGTAERDIGHCRGSLEVSMLFLTRNRLNHTVPFARHTYCS